MISEKWNNIEDCSSFLYSISQCFNCKHYNIKQSCKAFDVIPERYYTNLQKHNFVDDLQNGKYIYTSI